MQLPYNVNVVRNHAPRADEPAPTRGGDVRLSLAPHLAEYDARFSDSGEIRWLPYVMYFHPASHRSAVVNTDSFGFRVSTWHGSPVDVADHCPEGPVDLLVGSSTVFGIGASSDDHTLASRCNFHALGRSGPWCNMGGRSHNSMQELLLHVLVRHRLPEVRRIVLYSGFNDLGLARLPAALRYEGGGFFMASTFAERLAEPRPTEGRHRRLGHRRAMRHAPVPGGAAAGDRAGYPAATGPAAGEPDGQALLGLDEQVAHAADLVLRHLAVWRALAEDSGAELTYVLQPLATWVRPTGTAEEQALFAHLDRLGRFGDLYGDIADPEVGRRYAALLGAGCARLGVPFVDMAPLLAAALAPDDWMFVDRIHYTDFGYDLAARVLAEQVLE